MEFLSSIVGLVLCFYDHTSKHTVYIGDLKKNLQALSKEMVDLNNLCEDVKTRVERAEQRQMMRTKKVGGWRLWAQNSRMTESVGFSMINKWELWDYMEWGCGQNHPLEENQQ